MEFIPPTGKESYLNIDKFTAWVILKLLSDCVEDVLHSRMLNVIASCMKNESEWNGNMCIGKQGPKVRLENGTENERSTSVHDSYRQIALR